MHLLLLSAENRNDVRSETGLAGLASPASLLDMLLCLERSTQFEIVAAAELSPEIIAKLRANDFSAILLDLASYRQNSSLIFARAHEFAPHTPLIVVVNDEDDNSTLLLGESVVDVLRRSEVTPPLLGRVLRYSLRVNQLELALRQSEEVHERANLEALRVTEQRNKALLRAIPDTMFLMDRDGVTLDFHSGSPEDLILPPEEFLGKSVSELFPKETADRLLNAYRTTIETGENQQLEVALPVGSKSVYFEVRVVPYGDQYALSIVRNVTDRMRKEREQRIAEEKYRNLVEQLPAAVYIDHVVDGEVESAVYASSHIETMLGYPPEDFINNPRLWYELILPEDRERNQLNDVDHFSHHRPFYQQYRMRARDGRTVWVNDNAVIIWSDAENAYYSQGIVTDITEQKNAEAELRSAEERNRALLQAIPDLMFLMDRDGHYLEGYAGREEDLLIPVEQQIGRRVRDVLPPELADQVLAVNERALATNEMQSFEYSLPLADGTKYFEARVVPCGQDKVLSIVRNVNARRQAESALQAKEEEYRSLFENVPIGIFRTTPDGRHTRANPALVALNGFASEEEQIANVHDIANEWYVDPARRAEFSRLLEENDEISGFESEIYRYKTRERIWVSENARVVRDKNGEILYYEGTVSDITVRKQSEEALQRLNTELAQALKLKDEFLANMSHELRTPLSVILTLAESLIEGLYGAVTSRQVEVLSRIQKNGRHLLSLIADILDLAKIQSGTLELDINPIFVQEVCQTSLQMVQQSAQKKNLQVHYRIDTALSTITADERRLVQILVNLLTNAIKFTPEGGTVGLDVSADAEQNVTHFTVWDTGIGIAPEEQLRLFRPFVQLDAGLARRNEGVGLGLALVHRLAELHSGGIHLESVPGQGSRFTVSLPWRAPQIALNIEDEELASFAPIELNPTPIGSDYAQYTNSAAPDYIPLILLAEDNLFASQAFEEYLGFLDYRVVTARNGIEAISKATEHRPDLILMDVQMPDIDGLEATRQIRAHATLSHTPIIALTALAMPGDRERCIEAGCVDYISKPIELAVLANKIRSHLVVTTQ